MIDKYLEKLLNKLKVDYEPEIIPIELEQYSIERNCFNNVLQKVKIDGGKIHYGWILHENEFIYEAERHAVWENNIGNLVDITPQNNSTSIYFVSDDEDFSYSGQFIPNIRINVTLNNVVDDYIFILDKIDYLYTFSIRKNDFMIEIAEPIKLLIDNLTEFKDCYYTYIKFGQIETSQCFCSSSKIYKNCHGKHIKSDIEIAINSIKDFLRNS